MASIELVAAGHGGRLVPNEYIAADDASDHVGICLPGYSYRAGMPGLHYAMQHLAAIGAHRFTVDFAYDRNDEFMRLRPQEQLARVAADGAAALDALFAWRRFQRLTIVGKSLGTLAMIQLLPARSDLAPAAAVWLTPPLKDPEFVELLQQCPQRSLVIIGAADASYDATQVERVRGSGKTVVVLPGVDHALEVKGDVTASISAMQRMMEAFVAFLSAGT
jgi:hypothetical protein